MRYLLAFSLMSCTCGLSAQRSWTLEQCLQQAEVKSLDVRGAALTSDLADKGRSQTFWNYFPDLNAGATHGYNYGRVVDRFTNTFATDQVRTNNFWLSSDLVLFNGLRKQNEHRQAVLSADAAGNGLEAQRNVVRTLVVQQFLDILGLEERIRSQESLTQLTREQMERTQAFVDAGRLAEGELFSARSQVASQEYALTDLRNQHARAELLLAQTLQLEPTEVNDFHVEAPSLGALAVVDPVSSMEEVLSNVLQQDPAYKQAELQMLSSERGIAIARSGGIPSLSFNASVGTGYSGRNTETVGEPVQAPPIAIGYTAGGEVVYSPNYTQETQTRPFAKQLDDNLNESLGFTLSVPIFNNMRNKLAVDQARVQYEQAKIDRDKVRDMRRRDVQDAVLAQHAAYDQYRSADVAVGSAQRALDYAQERFAQGAISSLELSTARSDLERALAGRIDAKYTYLLARSTLDILQGLPVTL
ncbi:MAG: TolC family protein [Flavobacteriales bacterium]|nr:TolC family protein [Flavobacteriales bacterium]MCB9193401.1 TolC family protein [Flavobacteriales bacterium]